MTATDDSDSFAATPEAALALVAVGGLLAALASYSVVGVPVSSPVVAAVRVTAALAGAAVAVAAAAVARDRLAGDVVVPLAAAPTALGGAGVAVTATAESRLLWVSVGAALACAVLGFVVVAATAGDGDRA